MKKTKFADKRPINIQNLLFMSLFKEGSRAFAYFLPNERSKFKK